MLNLPRLFFLNNCNLNKKLKYILIVRIRAHTYAQTYISLTGSNLKSLIRLFIFVFPLLSRMRKYKKQIVVSFLIPLWINSYSAYTFITSLSKFYQSLMAHLSQIQPNTKLLIFSSFPMQCIIYPLKPTVFYVSLLAYLPLPKIKFGWICFVTSNKLK